MKPRITIKDIAKRLALHHSTVSRALRNDQRVKEDTRNLVVNYAKKHGYQVNMAALHLRGDLKNEIAIMVPNISHQFFSNIVSQITNLANQNNYVVSIFQSNESIEREKEIIKTIIQNNVAGVIASVSMETLDGSHFLAFQKYNIPLVFFDRVCDINVSRVVVDNYGILKNVVELFVKKNYRRIAHISGNKDLNVYKERQLGYIDGIKQHKLGYQRIYEVKKAFTVNDGKEMAEKIFSSAEKPDAIICDSYNLLLGVILKIKELGLNIPEDIGIIGFGENPSMEAIQPGISSIEQPDADLAKNVYDLLIQNIEDGQSEIKEIKLSAHIIERNTI